MSAQTLGALLETGDGERIALATPDGATALSTRVLGGGVEDLAGQLSAAGVSRGDRVVLVLADGPEYVQTLLAVTFIGAAAAPLNPAYTVDEFTFYIDDIAPAMVIAGAGEAAAAREAAGERPVLDLELGDGRPTLSRGGSALPRRAPSELAQPGDIALVLHTSGTTSRPKQVPLRHRNLMASTHAIGRHYALSSEDVAFATMPLFHVHGLVATVFAQLAAGGRVIAPRRLAPSQFWTALEPQGVTWFSGSPTILTMLLDRRAAGRTAPALRFVRACSAPLSSAFADRVEGDLGVPIVQAYGMTEASHQVASNPLPPGRRDPGSVGVATGTTIAIVDGVGRELPVGEAGEVVISGPGVMEGYLENPEANASAFTEGRLRTGDLGVLDAEGYLRLAGRIKELINRGGEKISPYEVEQALREHPAVADAACFAVPDEKYGEEVGAAVVLDGDADVEALRSFCGERLAAFKVPKDLRILDALPKTATGKVQRRKIAESFADSAR